MQSVDAGVHNEHIAFLLINERKKSFESWNDTWLGFFFINKILDVFE